MQRVPNHWTKFVYFDPRRVLPKLHSIRWRVARSDLDDSVKNLRTHAFKEEREAWDTAVLAYLLSEALNIDVHFSREECEDFDSVFCWRDGDHLKFTPVQLKELVPESNNPNSSLSQLFESLRMYARSPDLMVGIKLNRNIRIDFDSLMVPELPVGDIWLYGATTSDESIWGLWGWTNEQWVQYDVNWTKIELDALRWTVSDWAEAWPLINRVHLFGSRANGSNQATSDIDLAFEMVPAAGDESALATWMFESDGFLPSLRARIPYKIDAQLYLGEGTPTVLAGLEQGSVNLFDRNRKSSDA